MRALKILDFVIGVIDRVLPYSKRRTVDELKRDMRERAERARNDEWHSKAHTPEPKTPTPGKPPTSPR